MVDTFSMTFHINRRAAGSTPVLGSSKKISGGEPIMEMAKDSFLSETTTKRTPHPELNWKVPNEVFRQTRVLLFPPLSVIASLSMCGVKSRLLIMASQYRLSSSRGVPVRCAGMFLHTDGQQQESEAPTGETQHNRRTAEHHIASNPRCVPPHNRSTHTHTHTHTNTKTTHNTRTITQKNTGRTTSAGPHQSENTSRAKTDNNNNKAQAGS